MKISWIYPHRVEESKGGFLSNVDEVLEPNSLQQLGDLLCMIHFAPGVFRDNCKRQDHLQGIELLAFDFDTGKHKSNDINTQLLDINHLIVGSKNHLKDKGDGKGVIERFHVFIPTDAAITSVETYKYISRKFASLHYWDVDYSCLEPARYFYQHSAVLFVNEWNNKKVSLARFAKIKEYEDKAERLKKEWFDKQKRDVPVNERFGHSKYYLMLANELGDGAGRYIKRCKIAGGMKACGLSEDQAVALFIKHGGFGGKFTETTLRKLY